MIRIAFAIAITFNLYSAHANLGTYKHGKLISPDTNDSYTGNLRQHYINQVASRVKEQWRYQGAQDHWGCDVYILQDLNGKVQSVNLQSCNVSNSAKAKVFKDSIERAVYKASPLPVAPDKSVFDREISFAFKVAAETYFSLVKLPRGVEVEVPKGWWLLSADHNRMIGTTVEAVMDLSGYEPNNDKSVNLIAANSTPLTTYASLRIDSITPSVVSPEEIINLKKSDLNEFSISMERELSKLIPLQGNKILDFYGSHVERLDGHPALVTRYRRSGPKGPVIVEINQIFPGGMHSLRINLAYRESEKNIWLTVIKKIRTSIKMK